MILYLGEVLDFHFDVPCLYEGNDRSDPLIKLVKERVHHGTLWKFWHLNLKRYGKFFCVDHTVSEGRSDTRTSELFKAKVKHHYKALHAA